MVSVSTLITANDAGWLYPVRYKNGKLLVMGSATQGGGNDPGYVYIAEYDLTVSPPNLLRKQYYPSNTFTSGWGTFDVSYFDEQSLVAILFGYLNKIIVVDYNNFSHYQVYNPGLAFPVSYAVDKANDVLYIAGGGGIVKTQLSAVLNFGTVSFTNLTMPPPVISIGDREFLIVYWKGAIWGIMSNVRNSSAATNLVKSTDGGNTWTSVRQTQGDPNYSIPQTQIIFPKIAANENYLAYSYYDSSNTFKVAYTSDGTNFTVFDTGITVNNQTGEYHCNTMLAGKYLIITVTSRGFASNYPPSLILFKMWILDLTTGQTIYQADLTQTYPANNQRDCYVTEDGKVLFGINLVGGGASSSQSGAIIAAVNFDIITKLTLSLSGTTLTATLTDINNNPIGGKTLRAKLVNHANNGQLLDTNILTGITDNTGKVTFTLPSSGWWVVEYNGD